MFFGLKFIAKIHLGIKIVASFGKPKTIMKRIFLLLIFIPCIAISQNKLKKAKESLKEQTTEIKRGNKRVYKSSNNSNSSHTSYENPFSSLFAEIVFYATAGITIGRAEERDLNPYPYFYDDEGEYAAELSKTGRKSSVKLGANYLFNNVNSMELYGTYKPIPILAIDVSYLHFSEKNLLSKEHLNITSVMANYHRFRERNFTFWWGLGATYVGSGVNKTGFAYNIGTEIYPVKPISLHLSWKQSFINKSEVDIFKSQLKYHFKNKALYTGFYDYSLGGETVQGVVIGFEITF